MIILNFYLFEKYPHRVRSCHLQSFIFYNYSFELWRLDKLNGQAKLESKFIAIFRE